MIIQLNELRNRNNNQRIGVECESSWKSRSSALNPGTAYFKILMLIGTIQVFSIKRIIMMLENPNCMAKMNGSF